ncbi:hypothetical protein AAFN88_17790 [Pelagibius sp. CAU 1746]|uniref:hypothetical protein n=1 Tax=Pelagibius sp. CAU 1746 TaxID=3140370 RepID=UPI00325A459D
MSKLGKMDYDPFAREFLKAYLEDGFANMPKREIDLLVLRLLVEHTEGWSWDDPPSAFELARTLRAKRGRLRSMLDELSFRNAADEERAKARLHHLLKNGEKDIEGNRVRVQIEDGYLREYAKSLVQADFGIVDTSFDRSIVTLSGDKFLLLVAEVMGDEAKKEFEKELKKHRKELGAAKDKEGLLKTFLREFVKSAGKEAGKKSIKLGAAALTGGLSEIPDLIDSLLRKGDGNVDQGVDV